MFSYWPWFVGAVFVVFLALEIFAKLTNRPPLSRAVWRFQSKYPLLAFVAGACIGGLAVHFYGFIPACNP